MSGERGLTLYLIYATDIHTKTYMPLERELEAFWVCERPRKVLHLDDRPLGALTYETRVWRSSVGGCVHTGFVKEAIRIP